jgi:3-hydroxy-9,10-secoandrosta-1,3,5(10)-triene-9,17-dione monooxygenase reductase component
MILAANNMTFDAREFRDALSSFATGVTIVTAREEGGEPVGMTCSSFNSVSMDPPLVLWSVTKTSMSALVFKSAQHFAVHVLAFDQTEVSNRFARSGEDKFGATEHSYDANSVPIISGAASRFDCKQWAVHDGGDHWIIIGEVLNFNRSKKEGLVFAGGSYATASPIQPASVDGISETAQSPVDNFLFYHLSRAYHQVSSHFHAEVRASGLTQPEWRILACLHGGGVEWTVPILSKQTFIQPPALRDMLTSMEQEGLCAMQGTGQKAIIQGTPKGHAKVAHLFELDSQMEADVFGEKDTKESKMLFSLLNKIINHNH